MGKQNVTLSLDKNILQKIKLLAVKQNTSISALLSEALEELVAREEGYRSASQNHRRLLQQGFDLGTSGDISWSRDELHDR